MQLEKKKIGKRSVKKEEATRILLEDMRKRLLSEISDRIFPKTPPAADIGDVVDQALDERDQEFTLLWTDREKEKAFAVDEALEKLRKGTYGTCEECGESITPRRLAALPLAKLCLDCQNRLEKEKKLTREEEPAPASGDPDLVREIWEEEER
jgi:DnaK suppressor protein